MSKRANRIVDSSDDELSSPRALRKRARQTDRTMESFVGERVSFLRVEFSRTEPSEDDDERLVGTCEAWCPSTKSFLVVFDEPFDDSFNKFYKSEKHSSSRADDSDADDDGRRKSLVLSRLSIAIWGEPNKYLIYEPGELGWGGCCITKKGTIKRRACYWWGAWIKADEYFQRAVPQEDEPIFCLCRRVENAEPPPPLADDSAGDAEKSALIECEACKEWFHLECVVMATKKQPSPDESWRCPLCDSSVKSTRLSEREGLDDLDVFTKRRLVRWLHESKQMLWTRHPPVQWQWWPNGFESQSEGEWVFAFCTLRRFVNKKDVDDSLGEDQVVKSVFKMLNKSIPAKETDKQVELMWALGIEAVKKQEVDSATSVSTVTDNGTHSVVKSVAAVMSSSASTSHNNAAVNGPKASSVFACSRTRPFELHMAMSDQAVGTLDVRKKKSVKINHSDVVEDAAGRNQRLEIRRVASAVGESALTIGRRRRLRFGRSKIHMWGVYADEPIAAGEFVAEYKGEIISQKETDRRFNEYMAKGMPDYLFKIDTNLFCDATMKGSIARFINHSCDPSCEAKIVTHQNQKKIALYALRDIAVGEELCYDYKFPIEEGADNKIACNCGSKKCRKVMN